ncbi:hypothetical protein Zmor_028124 [Zophobas morio]|uniref:Fatty acyl-CoA reductase n=1 Tax=Zophobas morio TaxID=2755281 RepID=A0AA38HPI4_9CUCU|nr:hypothetical protein Zmor_028124 [Zophobas morio]
MSNSEIKQFFKNQTIFITGGTGFLGKLIIEKLLRECWDLKKILVLVRPKKGKTPQERFNEILERPCFHHIKNKNVWEKISLMEGDCDKPLLGLTDKDIEVLKNETTCIIHAAIRVKFYQSLRELSWHVRATKDLVEFAKDMKNFKAFVYISSQGACCLRNHIKEIVYPPPIKPETLLSLVETCDDSVLEKITPGLLHGWYDSYCYIKSITEDLVKTSGDLIPTTIIRPSNISSTLQEPIEGWNDTSLAAVSVIKGMCMGLVRTLNVYPEIPVHTVPADYVVNFTLAAAWKTAQNSFNTTMVYNCTGEGLSCEKLLEYLETFYFEFPSMKYLWFASVTFRRSKFWHQVWLTFYTFIVYVFDFVFLCTGNPTNYATLYKNAYRQIDVLTNFCRRRVQCDTTNVRTLWKNMSQDDKTLFEFHTEKIYTYDAVKTMFLGMRLYLLNDPIETVPAARKRLRKLYIVHYSIFALFLFLIYRFFRFLLYFVFTV